MPVIGSSSPRRRPSGVLLYGMYGLDGLDKAPTVRIEMMTRALDGRIHTERITGGRFGRAGAALRWLAGGGARRVGGVYVESNTSTSMPTDLAFLLLMRLLRRPVGVYFRDAYQLFRDIHPRSRRRQIVSDWVWRLTTPMLKRIATVRYAPSAGLAKALGLKDAVLLPPGTDSTLPDLGAGEPDHVAAIVQLAPRTGFDELVAAVAQVRSSRPGTSLRLATKAVDPDAIAALPEWVQTVTAGRAGLADALRDARVCVLPLPINAYTDLAVAVRLLDLLAFGKPIVATDTVETRALIEASGAGIVTPATADGLAGGIRSVLDDEALARRFAASARAYACSPESTWDARAGTVIRTLGLETGTASATAAEVPA